ncbi:MAG TPA: cation diffusion facilitator family transporter [Jatrophihabitantaceae bacterium]|nr:cation diffusion facilitator family transporter [Jatrophihabitantaceae bacterium]
MSREHAHVHGTAAGDRRWLTAALAVVVAFMVVEVVAGFVAHSLALLTDAGHMVTDAVALLVAVIAAGIARRPARGAYTYGFARVDALSGQANGITLLLLAVWFEVVAVRRLIDPVDVRGGVVATVAVIGAAVNVVALLLVRRADRSSLNVRGAFLHLLTDAWAFAATFIAGVVVLTTGWTRADAIASMVVGLLMAWTGWALVRAAGRVFLEAAPTGVDPSAIGAELAAVDGVSEVHDLHIWQIGSGDVAVSAHVLVHPPFDCHEVSSRLRSALASRGIGHVTLQTDHADAPAHDAGACEEAHGEVHVAPPT